MTNKDISSLNEIEDLIKELDQNNALAAMWFASNLDVIDEMCHCDVLPLEKMKRYIKMSEEKKNNLLLMMVFYKFMFDCDNNNYSF